MSHESRALTCTSVTTRFGERFPGEAPPQAKALRLPGESRLDYTPDWLPREEATALYRALVAALAWEERPIVVFGREVLQPRLIGWAGALPYRYSGQELPPRAEPPLLAALRARVAEAVAQPLNHVVANLYRSGEDHVSMHADNEPELGRCPLVASVSLGAARRFVIERKVNRKKRRFTLHHGSLLVMGGAFQHQWRHMVPRQPRVAAPRLNLTFRFLHGPPGWREPRR